MVEEGKPCVAEPQHGGIEERVGFVEVLVSSRNPKSNHATRKARGLQAASMSTSPAVQIRTKPF
jgi:hypothetical protein